MSNDETNDDMPEEQSAAAQPMALRAAKKVGKKAAVKKAAKKAGPKKKAAPKKAAVKKAAAKKAAPKKAVTRRPRKTPMPPVESEPVTDVTS